MKKFLSVLLPVFIIFASCNAQAQNDSKTEGKEPSKKDVSYAFGVLIGNNMKETGLEIDYSAFSSGMKDAMEKEKAKVTIEEAEPIVQAAIGKSMSKKAETALVKEKEFLEKNAKEAGVKTTTSGLQYKIISEGKGPKPKESDTVKVHYTGTLSNGKKFDSSIDRGEPAVFPVNRVIPGWTEGLQLLPVGTKAILYIPSALAYGPNGAGGVIGPNEPLTFEVELISIEK